MIEHVTETSIPFGDNAVNRISVEYIQEADNYKEDSADNTLTIGTEPGGYFYISTKRWAFDSIEELINILNDFKNKVKFAENESR